MSDPVTFIQRQEWPDTVDEALTHAIEAAEEAGGPAAQAVKDALHGTWLGHPLHPALTDLPIGAWTTALAMDALDTVRGTDDLAQGAETAIGVGLVGAVGAAVTGLADWSETTNQARKLGVVHGVMNGSATVLYTASWLLRRNGKHGLGRGVSLLGFGMVVASAWIGGHLVYGERIGVDHAREEELPEKWTPVLPDAELPPDTLKKVRAGAASVLLVRQGEEILALAEHCSHLGGPLSEGELKDGSVICPWHGSRFCLADGSVLDGPATIPQPRYETRVRDGQIEVRAVGAGRAATGGSSGFGELPAKVVAA